jgi:hypothetical protein
VTGVIPRVDAECGSAIVVGVVIVLVEIARIAVVAVVIVGDRRGWRDHFGRRRWLW